MPKDSTPPAIRGRRLLTFKQFLEMKKRMESVPPPAGLRQASPSARVVSKPFS